MVAHERIQAPTERLSRVFQAQRAAFDLDSVPTLGRRLSRLGRLQNVIERNETEIVAAIHADFGNRALHETRLADIIPSIQAIGHAGRKLSGWMSPRRERTDLMFWPGKSRVVPQPLGVVGIIAPWNYPLLLSVAPLVAAISAGNRAIVKPSEYAPRFSALFDELIREAFDETEVAVVTGGADVAQALTQLPLNHLVFTGSTRVGRQVARAAATNLTPVTLELGGKSPVILDQTADLETAIKRVVRGKMFNAGQTCIAPDYLLVPEGMVDAVVDRLIQEATVMYPTVSNNPELTSIINDGHVRRLTTLIEDAQAKGAEILYHAEPAEPQRRLPLTVIKGASDDMNVMKDEIFGPLLPVLPYKALDDALAFVRARPRPLALYWFGRRIGRKSKVMSSALAGGITINDTLLHAAQETLPFGGVGESGMGSYHGKYGFDRMSHLKPVFIQSGWSGADLMTPPMSDVTQKIMRFANRWVRR